MDLLAAGCAPSTQKPLDVDALAGGCLREQASERRKAQTQAGREAKRRKVAARKEQQRESKKRLEPYDLSWLSDLGREKLTGNLVFTVVTGWCMLRLAFMPRARGAVMETARIWQRRGQALMASTVLKGQDAALRAWLDARSLLATRPRGDWRRLFVLNVRWDEARVRLRTLCESLYGGRSTVVQRMTNMSVGNQVLQTLISLSRCCAERTIVPALSLWQRQVWFARPQFLEVQTAVVMLFALLRVFPLDLTSPTVIRDVLQGVLLFIAVGFDSAAANLVETKRNPPRPSETYQNRAKPAETKPKPAESNRNQPNPTETCRHQPKPAANHRKLAECFIRAGQALSSV